MRFGVVMKRRIRAEKQNPNRFLYDVSKPLHLHHNLFFYIFIGRGSWWLKFIGRYDPTAQAPTYSIPLFAGVFFTIHSILMSLLALTAALIVDTCKSSQTIPSLILNMDIHRRNCIQQQTTSAARRMQFQRRKKRLNDWLKPNGMTCVIL